MAPTPPTTTDRLKVFYTGPFGSHTMLFHRAEDSFSEASFVAAVHGCVELFPQLCWDAVIFDRAEYANAGSTAFFPEPTWVTITGGSGDDPTAASSPSAFLNWTARGLVAPPKRASLYLFEVQYQGANDMRLQTGENAGADSVYAYLNLHNDDIGNIAGQSVLWHQYTNVGQNDYLTHRARRGA